VDGGRLLILLATVMAVVELLTSGYIYNCICVVEDRITPLEANKVHRRRVLFVADFVSMVRITVDKEVQDDVPRIGGVTSDGNVCGDKVFAWEFTTNTQSFVLDKSTMSIARPLYRVSLSSLLA
jgi:hypothetical protein